MKKFLFKFSNREIIVQDHDGSNALPFISYELKKDEYGLSNINFDKGDKVIDIGAHVGLISIYLAVTYPDIYIYAVEPFFINYKNLIANIGNNNISNIIPINLAVTKDGREMNMICNVTDNTGGATSNLSNMKLPNHENFIAKSCTLDNLFRTYHIDKCKLLKIDCEGSEHEVLMNTGVLDKIEYLSAEFHMNTNLKNLGYSFDETFNRCNKYINRDKMKIKYINMAE